ncbi:MAG: glycoside hydrolase family 3 C-terminal domain-containing protein [Lachnospiraceae bacterium]|nr:glycoside hydrolase family 3 C-terminal domain-containing protein [Lachnospiraceae bacterium]
MDNRILDWEKYTECARCAAAEGQVLLCNENKVLPLPKGASISVFGRIQLHYYKSGTGSGGMVNVDKVTGILDALLEDENITVNRELVSVYREWEKTHPFNEGIGWGNEPWSQEEMPVDEELVLKAAGESDYALGILGRTAGEDQDNLNAPGAYLLTKTEEEMLEKVREGFSKMIVVLNVGNIIDMRFVERYHPDAVLYAWQGGMIGGLGTVDVLTGRVNPSGRLADTIAYRIEDYPSHAYFGNQDEDVYVEDIYVGYRYFETVAEDKVQYPFGFGLSYTDFKRKMKKFEIEKDTVTIQIQVENIGDCPGKEVIQIYVRAPFGQLGKPDKVLTSFAKTKELAPGEREEMMFSIPFESFASYDESGVTGTASSYVLERGTYTFLAGSSIRSLEEAGSFQVEDTKLFSQCSNAMAPMKPFERMKPYKREDGSSSFGYEETPLRRESPGEKRARSLPAEFPMTGDKGYLLSDVKEGRISMEAFIAQLSKEDLACIIRGEGMGSPKVTAGTAAAFGGVSENLNKLGIPCGCCTDGPSGMRLDSGANAFSLPSGTLLACTFNTELVEKLYAFTGVEMVKNKIDALLGPGMNIHRHPLNGRNFEYFSEDPLLTGKMAAAQIRGLHGAGVTGTIKHFCANNQETRRRELDSVVSERALREIYLKGFEIAVKEGGADCIMTTYGSVNGLWTAGNYDLNTVILRGEWGFEGIVMTDWWAEINEEGQPAVRTNFAAMAKAQNDLYMVCPQADRNDAGDNTLAALDTGTLTIGELQRNAMNICRFLMHTHAYERMNGNEMKVEVLGSDESFAGEEKEIVYHKVSGREITINLSEIDTKKGSTYVFALDVENMGWYDVQIKAKSDLGSLAQMPVTLIKDGVPAVVFTFNGTGGEWITMEKKIMLDNKYAVLQLTFGQNGLEAEEIRFTLPKIN